MEALTIKGVLVAEVGREEAQPKLTANDGTGLRREGSITSQVAADTSSVTSSAGGLTLKGVFWSIGEPLSQLGEKWLGNHFTALAGLILAHSMADVRAMPPQKTMEHMLYHFTDVNAFML